MNDHFEDNLINEFVAENRDHLETIEPDLLAMEQAGSQVSKDILNRVFRAIHSIKGSSGFFNLTAIQNLSHAMENLLMRFREGELVPDPDKIDALLCGVDKLRLMLSDVNASDQVPIAQELSRLNDFLRGTKGEIRGGHKVEAKGTKDITSKGTSSESPNPWEELRRLGLEGAALKMEKESVKAAVSSGLYVYAIQSMNTPLSGLASYGELLYQDSDKESVPEGRFIFATAMELDLLCDFLSLPKDKVTPLDRDRLLAALDHKDEARAPEKKTLETTEIHQGEREETKTKKGNVNETIRVTVDLIDSLMNLAGELVLARNQLKRELEEALHRNSRVEALSQNLNMVTSEIQEKIMQMRLQPVGNLFSKLPRLVRDLCRLLSKKADLHLEGEEVELDKSILEGLSDPLVHLLRNCMDHAIESQEERERAGKPPVGQIGLKAFHEGGQVNLVVSDDGRGIDPEKIAQKALTSGAITGDQLARMSSKEKMNLIFLPGFSTAQTVTEVSGRGVGMDVVKTNIDRLGGHFEIDSTPGHGTSVRIRLPLTLAIIPSLIIGVGGERFAIPQVNVKELVHIKAGDAAQRIEKVGEADVMRLRGGLLPLVRLADVLGLERRFVHPVTGEAMPDRRVRLADRRQPDDVRSGDDPTGPASPGEQRQITQDRRRSWQSDISVVVLRMGNNRFGLIVDDLYDTEEIVVKPLSDHIKDCKCFAGATIMGDGKVAMILDAAGIAIFTGLRFADVSAEERRRREEEERRKGASLGTLQSLILFNNAYEDYFALNLESISRLEKLDARDVHRSGNRLFMDYRGKALPLISLERVLPVKPCPQDADEYYVIIPKNPGPPRGILVSRILDALQAEVEITRDPATPPGILGAAFVGQNLVQFLNPDEVLRLFEGGGVH